MAIEKYGAKHLVCPKCGQDNDFQVICEGGMTAYVDGSGDIYEVDNTHPKIAPNSLCVCPECNYAEELALFEKPLEETNE